MFFKLLQTSALACSIASIGLLAFSPLLYSIQIDSQIPICHLEIHREGYSLSYDTRTRNAKWVYEKISSHQLKEGIAIRNNCSFKEDELIPELFRSTLKDYKFSGFDRGHLAAAANHKDSQEVLQETFFLSNICPQEPALNRKYWAKFEKHVRELTHQCITVEIFTGPLYLPTKDENGKKWVRYQVIGENDVAVPTHFYKVLILSKSDSQEIQSFILPNEQIADNVPLSNFRTTLEKVQKASGVLFFPTNYNASQNIH
jgi:endonuclease G